LKTERRDVTGAAGLSDEELIGTAREVLALESEALTDLSGRIGAEFVRAVRSIVCSGGTLIVCGVGKSGLVARKIAATFASTGTRSLFLHPADAAHGDVGLVSEGDVVLTISKSGASEEILSIVPLLRQIGVTVIAVTGDTASELAQSADIVLDAHVEREACPMDLVPTSSTTAALALGDALAVAVLKEKEFDRDAFAAFHPAGALGRRLLLRVRDVMHCGEDVPVVTTGARMKDAIVAIAGKRLGMTTVVDESGRLAGVVTDGDLKRILMRRPDILDARVGDVMTSDPCTIGENELVASALARMEQRAPSPITSLIIVDDDGRPAGVIHIHDCLRAVGQTGGA
jgi:arabinose-5-phosphate isomerase